MRKIFSAFMAVIILLSFSTFPAYADRLNVVTTIFPEYDFARAAAGDNADITMLIKPGAESHSFEPTPRDIINIQNCDIFIYGGGESEKWAERILAGIDTSGIAIIRLMDIVELREEEISASMQYSDEDDVKNEKEYDEHVWTSPVNAAAIVRMIAQAFAEQDPVNADLYFNNGEAYAEEILSIDEQIRDIVDNASGDTLVFGDRFPFLYLVKEYGLRYDAAYPGCSGDTEASASTIASLIRFIKSENIDTVLYIELSTHKLADTLCEATGAHGAMLHSCHNVTYDEFKNGETYVTLMTKNLDVLREALD